MNDNKYLAMCPHCGTELLKGKNADGVEICCRKCKRKYEVMLTIGTLLLKEMTVAYTASKKELD